jgi:hypothetical protein
VIIELGFQKNTKWMWMKEMEAIQTFSQFLSQLNRLKVQGNNQLSYLTF